MFAKFSLCATFAVLLTACAPNLRPAPQSAAGVNLAGAWTLDKARSDRVDEELRLALNSASEKEMKRVRSRRAPGMDLDGFPQGPSQEGERAAGPPPEPWWLREQKRLQEELIAAIKPPDSLRIVQAQGRVEMISLAGGAWRVFDPVRSSTLVTGYATLHIQSGWQGDAFVVQSADTAAKLKIIERYTLDAKGDLDQRLTFEMPDVKTQQYHVIYQRAD